MMRAKIESLNFGLALVSTLNVSILRLPCALVFPLIVESPIITNLSHDLSMIPNLSVVLGKVIKCVLLDTLSQFHGIPV